MSNSDDDSSSDDEFCGILSDSDSDSEYYDSSDDEGQGENYLLRGRKKRIFAYNKLSAEEKWDLAKEATITKCRCKNKHCLRGGDTLVAFLVALRKKTNLKSDAELFSYVQSAFDPVATSDSRDRYVVGRSMKLSSRSMDLEIRVCRDAWALAHHMPPYIFRRVTTIMRGDGVCNTKEYNDRTRPEISKEHMAKLLHSQGIEITFEELIAMTRANSIAAGWAVLWIQDWLKVAGHPGPTGSKLTYCEGIERRQMHDEYLYSFKDPALLAVRQTAPLRYNDFRKLLSGLFKHVKFVGYKGVGLKCEICAKLTGLRRACSSKEEKTAVATLHMLHRSLYMGQRHAYYLRQVHSMENSRTVWSFISDGYQQDHCNLPHRGNTKSFSDPMPQHIQGILSHFREIMLFRTFHNYGAPANLIIHTLLIALERRYSQEECIPAIIYIQIDGGSENRGHLLLALCEFLVRAGFVTDKIVLTRLPAGHTHEDIDAHFAKIWRKIRLTAVLTPQHYYDILNSVFSKRTHVQDIFLMPNYEEYFGPYVDKPSNYGTGFETQHQWLFKVVDKSERYPTGVKVLFRAYADPTLDFDQDIEDAAARSSDHDYLSQSVIDCVKSQHAKSKFRKCFRTPDMNFSLLRDKDSTEDDLYYPRVWEVHKAADVTEQTSIGELIGWSPVSVEHRWYPLSTEPPILLLPGDLPSGPINPMGFYADCQKLLLNTFRAVVAQYPDGKSKVVEHWHQWISRPEVPKTDDVQLYMRSSKLPLLLPLRDELFAKMTFISKFVPAIEKSKKKERSVLNYVKAQATSTIGYSGNMHESLPSRRLKSGLVFAKIYAPYHRYRIDDLRYEIRNRGLADPTGDRKSSFKKDVYIRYLEEADKFGSSLALYQQLPVDEMKSLLVASGIDLTANMDDNIRRFILLKNKSAESLKFSRTKKLEELAADRQEESPLADNMKESDGEKKSLQVKKKIVKTKEHHVDSAPVMPVMRATKIDASDEARNTSIDENLKLVRKRKKPKASDPGEIVKSTMKAGLGVSQDTTTSATADSNISLEEHVLSPALDDPRNRKRKPRQKANKTAKEFLHSCGDNPGGSVGDSSSAGRRSARGEAGGEAIDKKGGSTSITLCASGRSPWR